MGIQLPNLKHKIQILSKEHLNQQKHQPTLLLWLKTLKHQHHQPTRIHQPRVTLSYLQNPCNLKFLTFITTDVKSTTSPNTPRIPLTPLFTSVVTMKIAAPFSVTQSKKTIPSTLSRKIIGLRPQ